MCQVGAAGTGVGGIAVDGTAVGASVGGGATGVAGAAVGGTTAATGGGAAGCRDTSSAPATTTASTRTAAPAMSHTGRVRRGAGATTVGMNVGGAVRNVTPSSTGAKGR